MAGLLLATIVPNVAVGVSQAVMDAASKGYGAGIRAQAQAGQYTTVGASAPTVGPSPMVTTEQSPPVFRSSVTVWNPAWILVVIAGIWLIASKGGRK